MLIDVGTNNEAVRSAPGYGGVRAPRLRGDAYASLLSEVVHAVRAWAPRRCCNSRTSTTPTRSRCCAHRTTLPCFNDDIEGTASVACAAVLAAVRARGRGGRERASQRAALPLSRGGRGGHGHRGPHRARARAAPRPERGGGAPPMRLPGLKGLVCASRLEGGAALPAGHPRRGLADHRWYAHPCRSCARCSRPCTLCAHRAGGRVHEARRLYPRRPARAGGRLRARGPATAGHAAVEPHRHVRVHVPGRAGARGRRRALRQRLALSAVRGDGRFGPRRARRE